MLMIVPLVTRMQDKVTTSSENGKYRLWKCGRIQILWTAKLHLQRN